MIFVILGVIILAVVVLIVCGFTSLSVMNAAMWMDDSMR